MKLIELNMDGRQEMGIKRWDEEDFSFYLMRILVW